jgi:predicted small metal-binding protein
MKSFACGDVVPGCTASWVCSTDDEILVLVARHASTVHGISPVTPELAGSITDRIVAVS